MGRVAATIRQFLERPDAERRLGPFLLVKQLGSGGFAPVWLAKEIYGTTEVRTAAVKLFALHRTHRRSGVTSVADDVRAGIIAETSALCKVEHPNVVRFYSLPIDEASGVMGLAMEHIAGTSLDRRLARIDKLSAIDALSVGIAIASALSAVHRAGLVHRDVKPSNVIEAGGVYKLIDFGIAAADILRAPDSVPSGAEIVDDLPLEIEHARPRAGSGGTTIPIGFQSGTTGYLDPVCVAASENATSASDLYSLGAMLFECLTGKVPAAAAVAPGKGLDDDVLEGFSRAPPLETIAPEVPPSLRQVIDSLLAPERGDRPPSAEWVATRFEKIRSDINALRHVTPPEDVGPFRGLGRFEESDRNVYFGRESEIARAIKSLGTRGLVTISGSSGSGKSSLARAGVLPALAEGGLGEWPPNWDTAVAEPGSDPRAAVAQAVGPFAKDADAMTPEALVAALADRAQREGRGLVLLLDQLEELVTLASGESQMWTAEFLVQVEQKACPGVRVLAAARRDMLDPLLALGRLGESLSPGLLLIKPITDEVWGDVLDQALATYGYTFEDDTLRSELLAQLEGTVSAMPLVQFALTELWRKRDPDAKKITRKGLKAIGGIAGALERHADATLESHARAHAGGEDAARLVLLALTTPQGTRSTRTLADLREDVGPEADSAITALERARLIMRGAQGTTLAHEALLTQWNKLRTWVAEAREDRLFADEIERDAARWHGDPEIVPLWPRRRLAIAEDLQKRGAQRLSASAVKFLKASRWATLRIRLVIAGAVVMLALLLLGIAYEYVRAEQRYRRIIEGNLKALEVSHDDVQRYLDALKQAKDAAEQAEIERKLIARQNQERQLLEEQARSSKPRALTPPIVVTTSSPSVVAPRPLSSSAAQATGTPERPAPPTPSTSASVVPGIVLTFTPPSPLTAPPKK